MANVVYDIAKRFLVATSSGVYKRINLLSSTAAGTTGKAIMVTLVSSAYTTANSSQRTFKHGGGVAASVSPSCAELNSTKYTKGINGTLRKVLTSKTMSIEDGNTRSIWTAANVTWTGINQGSAYRAFIIAQGGAGSTAILSDTGTILICSIDSGFPVLTNGGDLTISWSTAGILDIT